MKIPTYQWIGQMLAALGVTVSLALVAWKLKQSRDLGMADLYQQTAAMTMDYLGNSLQNKELQDAYAQWGEDPSQLTERQISQIVNDTNGWMFSKESIFYQHRLGVTPAKEWEVHQRVIANFAEVPCFENYWKSGMAQTFHADFAAEVDRIWENLPEAECPLDR